jgi:hypothetical protein
LSQKLQPQPEESLLARHEALFRVSRAINVYRDPRELFRDLAKQLRQVVDFDFIGLFLYDVTANKAIIPVPLMEPWQDEIYQVSSESAATFRSFIPRSRDQVQ